MVARLRIGQAEDRRKPPRCNERLTFSALLLNAETCADGTLRPLKMVGHTCDISTDGLVLVVPSIRFAYRHLIGNDQTLRFTLELPTGLVEIKATPVHYRAVDEDKADMAYLLTGAFERQMTPVGHGPLGEYEEKANCLINVRITEMSGSDRARFEEYLHTLFCRV